MSVERPPLYQKPDALVGRTFHGRYEVLERIGEGGMGAVYRARQIAMDRMVALKVIRQDQTGDQTAVKRFYREMKTTSRIAHPNTVTVYDFGTSDEGELFLAMELLDGQPLSERIARTGALPVRTALKIATQILKALSAAHAEKVIHRDLKPENVMLLELYGEPDQVRVLDFGIAVFTESTEDAAVSRVTASGIMMGTPSYVSPEQIGGEPLDARSDLYTFGVLLYEMICGELPFRDERRPLRVLQMHMTERPKPPSERVSHAVPEWVDAVVLRLLAKYREDRPASADEVIAEIEAHPPVGTPTPRPAPQVQRPAEPRRNNTVLVVVLMVGMVLVASLAGVVIGASM